MRTINTVDVYELSPDELEVLTGLVFRSSIFQLIFGTSFSAAVSFAIALATTVRIQAQGLGLYSVFLVVTAVAGGVAIFSGVLTAVEYRDLLHKMQLIKAVPSNYALGDNARQLSREEFHQTLASQEQMPSNDSTLHEGVDQ